MELCVFSVAISLIMRIVRMYVTSSYYHHQIGGMTHLPLSSGLGYKTMVCAICLCIFLLLIKEIHDNFGISSL